MRMWPLTSDASVTGRVVRETGYGFILTFTAWASFQHHVYIWIKLRHFEASGRPQAGLFSRTLFEFVSDIVGAFVPVLHLPCSVPLAHHGAIGAQWGLCFSCTSVHVPLGPPSAVLLIWFLDLSAPTKWVNTLWGVGGLTFQGSKISS